MFGEILSWVLENVKPTIIVGVFAGAGLFFGWWQYCINETQTGLIEAQAEEIKDLSKDVAVNKAMQQRIEELSRNHQESIKHLRSSQRAEIEVIHNQLNFVIQKMIGATPQTENVSAPSFTLPSDTEDYTDDSNGREYTETHR